MEKSLIKKFDRKGNDKLLSQIQLKSLFGQLNKSIQNIFIYSTF